MKRKIYGIAYSAIKMLTRRGKKLCNNIAVVKDDKVVVLPETWCSSGLSYVKGQLDAVISLTCYKYYSTKINAGEPCSEAERVRFFDWLCNRSPYSKCISTKNAKFAANNGIIINTNFPANLVVGAIIASRVTWEYRAVCRTMLRFVDAGMNESAAFFLAHSFMIKDGMRFSVSLSSGHCALNYAICCERTLLNFVNGVQVNPYRPMEEGRGYDDIHILWHKGKMNLDLYQKFLDNAYKEYKVEKLEEAALIPNPFANSLVLRKEIKLTSVDSIAALVQYTNKLINNKDN